MALRNILVTGANKGIGEAIIRKILAEHDDVFVLLGSRSENNGVTTRTKILQEIPKSKGRIDVVVIDVSDDESVVKASSHVSEKYKTLWGLVNNAGIGSTAQQYKDILDVNFLGLKRVFDNFRPLLAHGGKVVNVTSGAGPIFVDQMEVGVFRDELLSKQVTWTQLEGIMASFISAKESSKVHPFGDLNKVYYFSKALANAYTIMIARDHPDLLINACTPGFVATDLTRHRWESVGKTPGEVGCKTVEQGAFAPCHVLFEVGTSGKYYGGDGVRSPLHKFRPEGEEEYHSDPDE